MYRVMRTLSCGFLLPSGAARGVLLAVVLSAGFWFGLWLALR